MLIGCYYYAWYSKDWLRRTVRALDKPKREEYNNVLHGPVIEDQMAEMKKYGIDFIAASWTGDDHGRLLDAANKTGMKLTYFYETFEHRDHTNWVLNDKFPDIVEKVKVAKEDMNEQCWLRIDGRPVIMFYVTRALENPQLFLSMFRQEFPNAFVVGDEYFWEDVNDRRIIYDAMTAYNMYQPGRFIEGDGEQRMASYLDTVKTTMDKHARQCERLGKPLWGCAMPGYDDTGVRPDQSHPVLPRMEGRFFERSLRDAIDASVGEQAVMICSYNEWYEDTQIEPTEGYGSKYLEIIKAIKDGT